MFYVTRVHFTRGSRSLYVMRSLVSTKTIVSLDTPGRGARRPASARAGPRRAPGGGKAWSLERSVAGLRRSGISEEPFENKCSVRASECVD